MKDVFRVRPWLRWAVFALSAIGACAGESSKSWIRGIYTGESPRPVAAELNSAWQQATDLAEHTAQSFVLVGSGQSMRPLYEPGTILVLRQIPFAQLKYGQTVLYRNQHRRVVAHVLVARGRDGWRMQGLNNRTHDLEPLCPENFVGVVIAAYQPTSPLALVRLAAAH